MIPNPLVSTMGYFHTRRGVKANTTVDDNTVQLKTSSSFIDNNQLGQRISSLAKVITLLYVNVNLCAYANRQRKPTAQFSPSKSKIRHASLHAISRIFLQSTNKNS